MIGLGTAALRILVAIEPQDLRKGFQGLAEVALAHMAEQLGRETLFVFTNRTRTHVRLLYFVSVLISTPAVGGGCPAGGAGLRR